MMKSRKLWFFSIAGIMVTILFINSILSENAFTDLLTIILITYAGGNVGEHFSKKP